MKVKGKKKVKTTIRAIDGGIELTHSQSVRQSLNYQSSEVQYGVKMRVNDDHASVTGAIQRMEAMVEERLAAKFVEQHDLLASIKTD